MEHPTQIGSRTELSYLLSFQKERSVTPKIISDSVESLIHKIYYGYKGYKLRHAGIIHSLTRDPKRSPEEGECTHTRLLEHVGYESKYCIPGNVTSNWIYIIFTTRVVPIWNESKLAPTTHICESFRLLLFPYILGSLCGSELSESTCGGEVHVLNKLYFALPYSLGTSRLSIRHMRGSLQARFGTDIVAFDDIAVQVPW